MKLRLEDLQTAIARRCPKWLVYQCTIRAGVYATTGVYGTTVVPNLTLVETLKRWSNQ